MEQLKNIFIMKDNVSGKVSSLIIEDNVDIAKRQFIYAVRSINKAQSVMRPKDIDLYFVGDFSERTGEVFGKTPELIMHGSDVALDITTDFVVPVEQEKGEENVRED